MLPADLALHFPRLGQPAAVVFDAELTETTLEAAAGVVPNGALLRVGGDADAYQAALDHDVAVRSPTDRHIAVAELDASPIEHRDLDYEPVEAALLHQCTRSAAQLVREP